MVWMTLNIWNFFGNLLDFLLIFSKYFHPTMSWYLVSLLGNISQSENSGHFDESLNFPSDFQIKTEPEDPTVGHLTLFGS